MADENLREDEAADAPRPTYLDERGRIIAPSIERPDNMTPVTVKLPSIAELKDLTDAQLLEVSQRYGIYQGWNDVFRGNANLLSQFSAIPPGSDEFWARVEGMTEKMSGFKTAKALARYGMRNYNQLVATDGNPDQILVRVGEGDEAMCDECRAMESAEGTYGEHAAIGLPGEQECNGHCRCMLLPVETGTPPDDQTLLGGNEAQSVFQAIFSEEW